MAQAAPADARPALARRPPPRVRAAASHAGPRLGRRTSAEMGNVGRTTPRVVLTDEVQLHFKGQRVNKEVAELLKGWFEEGAPLGLTPEVLEQVMRLQGRARPFFETFDTDGNGKVDAFEVLAAFIILASGTVDEKIEAVFPVFDFSAAGRLNFDEANILVHSVYRGLQKVCKTTPVDDEAIIEVCRQMFDSHNLPYDRQITKEQVKRWLRSDFEAAAFIDVFHRSYSLVEVEASLAEREQRQAAVFHELCGPASSSVPAETLFGSDALRQALLPEEPGANAAEPPAAARPADPEEALRALFAEAAAGAAPGPPTGFVSLDRFAEAAGAPLLGARR